MAPPSKIGIKPGEVYTVEELLYALLLNSANDAARALAERVSGSEEAFARDLTRQVRQWGAYRTTLATANGLPADKRRAYEALARRDRDSGDGGSAGNAGQASAVADGA